MLGMTSIPNITTAVATTTVIITEWVGTTIIILGMTLGTTLGTMVTDGAIRTDITVEDGTAPGIIAVGIALGIMADIICPGILLGTTAITILGIMVAGMAVDIITDFTTGIIPVYKTTVPGEPVVVTEQVQLI